MRSELKSKHGFTLIELSFSLVFISILSLAVVFVIINTIQTYNRGLLLNRVNTVGMDLVDDMRAVIQNSPADALKDRCDLAYVEGNSSLEACRVDGGKRLLAVVKNANVTIGSSNVITDVPVFGAFCAGGYSFIWNSGYLMSDNGYTVEGVSPASIKYKVRIGDNVVAKTYPENNSDPMLRLLKVKDSDGSVCASAIANNYNKTEIESIFDLTSDKFSVVDEEPVDLLAVDDNNNLVIYDLMSAVSTVEGTRDVSLYTVSFVLGSVQGGINIKAPSNFCATNGEEGENLDFCTVNKFNFAAMAFGSMR